MRARIFLKYFCFILIITLAFFLGLEGLLRILVAPPLSLFLEKTDSSGRVMVQYRVGANRPKFLKEKPAGVFRIFAYGESSTMGIPYSPRSSFPKMLEFALRVLENATYHQSGDPMRGVQVIGYVAPTFQDSVPVFGEVTSNAPLILKLPSDSSLALALFGSDTRTLQLVESASLTDHG